MYGNEGIGRAMNTATEACAGTVSPAGTPVQEAFDRVLRTQSMIGERIYALRDRLSIVLRNDPPTKDGGQVNPREVGQSDMHQALLNLGDGNAELAEVLENLLRRLTI